MVDDDGPGFVPSRGAARLSRRYARLQAQVALQNPGRVLDHLRSR
jgi:hypothetical protein